MVEIPRDEHDNRYYHQSNGHPPLENIMGEGNYHNSMVQQPLLNAFQHQQTAVTSATTESGQENDGYEALNTTNALANNYYLPNSSENSTMQADLSGETLNINILALAATAASMERPMAPQQILPQLSSPTFQNPPIQEIRFNNGHIHPR
jgi:hypothetical protein